MYTLTYPQYTDLSAGGMMMTKHKHLCTGTPNPTWGVIFESSKPKSQTSLLLRFSEKRRSSFELWNSIRKCHPKWDWLYTRLHTCMYKYVYICIMVYVYTYLSAGVSCKEWWWRKINMSSGLEKVLKSQLASSIDALNYAWVRFWEFVVMMTKHTYIYLSS